MLIGTGMRMGEVLMLKIGDVDLLNGVTTVNNGKTEFLDISAYLIV